jgi:MFS family permease
MMREIAEGFRFVRSETWLWATLLAAAIGLLCFFGPFNVLVPFLVKHYLHQGAGGLGLVYAAGGVGALLASFAMGQRGLPRRHIVYMYVAWGVGTLVMAGYALSQELWQAMAISVVMSALFTAGLIVWGTLMHTLVPAELLGRVSSLDWLVSTSLIPLSFAVIGPIATALGARETLAGAGLLGGVSVLLFLLIPGIRATETDGRMTPSAAARAHRRSRSSSVIRLWPKRRRGRHSY